jgi:uncharacterized protein YodC (DUF2158 family)
MSTPIPPHHESAATFALEGVQQVALDASAATPSGSARPRPANRPRVAPPTPDLAAEQVQFADWLAQPASPGTRARPRPAGRERHREYPPDALTRAARAAPGYLDLGDVVTIRSGGPLMTVVGFADTPDSQRNHATREHVQCGWFHEGDYRCVVLPRAALTLVQAALPAAATAATANCPAPATN